MTFKKLKEHLKKNFFVTYLFKPFYLFLFLQYRSAITKFKIKRLLKQKAKICIDIGGGNRNSNRPFLTVDITKKCDLFVMLPRKLPFPDNSVEFIYSSHTLEHFSFNDIIFLLNEFYRVLKPGGKIRIAVPNARIYINMYCNKVIDNDLFKVKDAFYNTTLIDVVNYIAYMNGAHKYMFDEENLLYLLEKANFKNVKIDKFDESLDLQDRKYNTIYAYGEKI
ncbi:MAG: methyltransferase domain-containing protein [Bacteroidales bacterium]|nr:methyltransferase domain-containing protein [Bacteroidales bacterium]